MVKVQIGQASQNEKKGFNKGVAGNQEDKTGVKETNIRDWYKYSKGPWMELIRCYDSSIASSAADILVKLVKSKLVGYDMDDRNTLWDALDKYNWNVDKYITSGEKTEADCSSFVYAAYCVVLPSLRESKLKNKYNNSPNTSSTAGEYNKYGDNKFDIITDRRFLDTPNNLQVGDLINIPGHHIIMVVSVEGEPDGDIVTTNSAIYQIGSKGRVVRQIQEALGIPVDGDFRRTTEAAVKKFQIENGLTVSGVVDRETLKTLGLLIDNQLGESKPRRTLPYGPNKVYLLSSVSHNEKDELYIQDDDRKEQFAALQKTLVNDAAGLGRTIYMTSEMYDSNILKGTQKSIEIRT